MTDYPDNFANYPKSLTEVKAASTGAADVWSPRDVLIDVLRKLDSGEARPSCLAVVWVEKLDERTVEPNYSVSSPNIVVTIGLLDLVRNRILNDADE